MLIETSPKPRKRLSLTPLVDVIFLLLMFFMLSSSYLKYADIDLGDRSPGDPASPSGEDLAQEEQILDPGLTVLIRVGANGLVEINGEPVDRVNLVDRLDRFANSGTKSALLMASGQATVQDLITALETARRSRIDSIILNR